VLKRTKVKNLTKVTFVLPTDDPEGPVSVVGDFNDWQPGVNMLMKRSNGTRSASVTLAPGEKVRFRYLGADGRWFDDDSADGHDGQNSIIVT
jgi:hypothetical protein